MRYDDLIILIPSHSLEDFPLFHTGQEAHELLVAWTALWHPGLIVHTGQMPHWARADEPPEELEGRLVLVPQVSQELLLVGWVAKARQQGACVVEELQDRQRVWAQAQEFFGLEPWHAQDWVEEFYALGYAFLQEELLTRQMRYMSNLDEEYFQSLVVEAAQKAAQGQTESAQAVLGQCYELLMESRQRYYPVDAYLVDLLVVASSTLGPELRRELSRSGVNVLCPASVLEQMAQHDPDSLALLRKGVESGQVSVVGGSYAEEPWPLLPLDQTLAWLRLAQAVYRRHLGQEVRVFGQRRFGLCAWLPQVLARLGYQAALHFPLDEGAFPQATQAKIHWQSPGSCAVDALARVPVDAGQSESLLNFCERLGNTMDMDHVATVSFARWPGKACPFFEDLRRIERHSAVLGRFVTLQEYFQDTELPGEPSRFAADSYRTPYLRQEVASGSQDPATRFVPVYRRWAWEQHRRFLSLVQAALGGPVILLPEDEDPRSASPPGKMTEPLRQHLQALARQILNPDTPAQGYLLLNPWPWSCKVEVPLKSEEYVPWGAEGLVAQQLSGTRQVLVEVPGGGYRWVPCHVGQPPSPPARGREPPMVEPENFLMRNEYFQLHLDPNTGAIAALHDYRHRGNRLSQQLALRSARLAAGSNASPYSVMKAQSVEFLHTGPALACAQAQGHLLDRQGRPVARFVQKVQIWRRLRVLKLEVELEPEELPSGDPWENYYACRWAWPDETALMFRGVAGMVFPCEATRVEAPLFVRWETDTWSTTVLCGGMAYHRRVGLRMLDTLLIPPGETQRRFTLGLGIDVKNPLEQAVAWLAPPQAVACTGSPEPRPSGAWFFTAQGGSVLPTAWSPLVEGDRLVGYRVRLLEPRGQTQQLRLRSLREVTQAQLLDFQGQSLTPLRVQGDAVLVDLDAHEWAEVEVRFADSP